MPSPLLAELRALTRDRERLVWNQRDTENQLRAIVMAYHPAVLELFSSLDRGISLAFLRDYPDTRAGRADRHRADGSVLLPARLLRRTSTAWLLFDRTLEQSRRRISSSITSTRMVRHYAEDVKTISGRTACADVKSHTVLTRLVHDRRHTMELPRKTRPHLRERKPT